MMLILTDFKAANYSLRPDGRIALVDFVPRVNSSYFRYFKDEPSVAYFDKKERIERFLYHQLKHQPATPTPNDPESGWKVYESMKGVFKKLKCKAAFISLSKT